MKEFLGISAILAAVVLPGVLVGYILGAPLYGVITSVVILWIGAIAVGSAKEYLPDSAVQAFEQTNPSIWGGIASTYNFDSPACNKWREKIIEGGPIYNNGSPDPPNREEIVNAISSVDHDAGRIQEVP